MYSIHRPQHDLEASCDSISYARWEPDTATLKRASEALDRNALQESGQSHNCGGLYKRHLRTHSTKIEPTGRQDPTLLIALPSRGEETRYPHHQIKAQDAAAGRRRERALSADQTPSGRNHWSSPVSTPIVDRPTTLSRRAYHAWSARLILRITTPRALSSAAFRSSD